MNTDIQTLLFSCLQYSYNKHVRTRWRINNPQLSILSSIYYAIHGNPKRWRGSIKQCIRRLNPQLGPDYIIRDLHKLDQVGLITYSEVSPKDYSIKLTRDGKELIESLFNTESIVSYIEVNKDRL